MRTSLLIPLLAMFAANGATANAEPNNTCPLEQIKSAQELHEALGRRAVEIVRLAGSAKVQYSQLAALVSPQASFRLIIGDVGLPLGEGIEGVQALAKAMNASTYRILGWDYMDMPVDACSAQKVTVEFTNTSAKIVSDLEFNFEAGLLVKAQGWSHTFETGPVRDAPSNQK